MKKLMLIALASLALQAQPIVTRVATATIAVDDYDKAIEWYTQKLGLVKTHDAKFHDERFVTVAPADQKDFEIALAKVGMTPREREEKKSAIGNSGPFVFHTADCRHAYEVLRERGVEFKETPRDMPWGTQAVALDLYGNSIVLLQPKQRRAGGG
jgi:predicted enzyme related to lactoylglutathione lyase